MKAPGYSKENDFTIELSGNIYKPPKDGSWITGKDGMQRLKIAQRLFIEGKTPTYKLLFDDFPLVKITNIWTDTVGAYSKIYVVQTNESVIQRCLLMTTDLCDLVIDPTCGSGTTAYVAEQWDRRWITIDTSRVALALARTRIMSAKYPYYILADSPEGVMKEAEILGLKNPPSPPFAKGGNPENKGLDSGSSPE